SDGMNCDLGLKTNGFEDTVVWNPAAVKARTMRDLGEANWDKFVCVEAGSVAKPVQLEPGQKWQGEQGIRLKLDCDDERLDLRHTTQNGTMIPVCQCDFGSITRLSDKIQPTEQPLE